jgi:hypothetical protein
MASITAVEFGAGTCALARTSVRRGVVRLSAAEILDPAAFPGIDAFTIALRQTRRTLWLPRRCRVVLWGLPEGANRKDAAIKPLLEPLTNAGFRIERVVSPCNALSALARLKTSRGEGSTCWLAINRGGVAIVVVRPGKQLYSHSFAWDSSVGSTGSQARLLQRYSLVAFLAPEVKRAMAHARTYGTPVDAVVTCGNLPDLRSLTMPLIEELDVEVETLDSLEGLVVTPQTAEKLSEFASAIRLACAAALSRGTRPVDESRQRSRQHRAGEYMRAAALIVAVVGIAAMWYVRTRTPPPLGPMPSPQASAQTPASRIEDRDPKTGKPGDAPRASPIAPRNDAPRASNIAPPSPSVSVPAPAVSVPANKPESNPKKPDSNPTAPSGAPIRDPRIVQPQDAPRASPIAPRNDAPRASNIAPPSPSVSVPVPAVRVPAPAVSVPAKKPESNPKKPESNPPAPSGAPIRDPRIVQPRDARRASPIAPRNDDAPRASPIAPRNDDAPRASPIAPRNDAPRNDAPRTPVPAPRTSVRPAAGLNTAARAADKAEVGTVRAPRLAASRLPLGPTPPLLKEAFPRVTAILVASDRRFATLDGGQIVGIGDLLGRRTVVGMNERSVVFQEPSGLQIRIGLGGRLLGVERVTR